MALAGQAARCVGFFMDLAMAGDWIKIHRKLLRSRVFSDEWLLRLWVWCLIRANFQDGWYQSELIPRGSFATGQRSAAEDLQVSPAKWWRGMRKLESFGQIAIKSNSRFSVVSVCNYESYQDDKTTERIAGESPVNSERIAGESPVNSERIAGESRANSQRIQEKEEQEREELQEREEGKKKAAASRQSPPYDPTTEPLPFSSTEFAAAWTEWCRHRQEIRKKLTATSVRSQIRQFAEWGESRSIAAIRHTVAKGWTGLREPDAERPQYDPADPRGTFATGLSWLAKQKAAGAQSDPFTVLGLFKEASDG